uniref:Uncharacterized protein n=1 Tax=Arundo donax TaxID=35708 RepID=A0A0A9BY89_ARUDO
MYYPEQRLEHEAAQDVSWWGSRINGVRRRRTTRKWCKVEIQLR